MTQPSSEKIGELDEFPPINFLENVSFPVDIRSSKFMSISLPPLTWLHLDKMPSKINIRNSGYLLNVEPVYSGQVPSLSGSVLRCPYEFWCFHFHWGEDNKNGSEHRIDGKRLPMEIHLLFYNVSYSNTTEALKAKDGILVLVYMCKLVDKKNLTLEALTSDLAKISIPNKSTCVNAFPMSSLFDSDLTDYMLYWRAWGTDTEKQTPWIIAQKPVWINESQLTRMRLLRGSQGSNMTSNCLCQRRYRRSENVFMVTADGTRTAEESELDKDHVVKDDLPPPRLECPVITKTCAAEMMMVTGLYDLEGGRAQESELGDDEPEVKRLLQQSVKRICAVSSIDMLMPGHIEDNPKEFKTEIDEPQIVRKTHREGVRMTKTAIRREMHIKNKLQKTAELKKMNA